MQLNVRVTTLYNWEHGRAVPSIRMLPRIIRFLGYDPCAGPTAAFPDRLRACRRRLGLSRKQFAKRLKVNPSTLGRWETGKGRPRWALRVRAQAVLAEVLGRKKATSARRPRE
jgi:transcriptional regulator with XRE-family HTH domain